MNVISESGLAENVASLSTLQSRGLTGGMQTFEPS